VIRSRWLRWIAHCGVGEMIGVAVVAGTATVLNRTLGEPESPDGRLLVLAVMVAAGAVEGLSLGYFQWRAMRSHLPELPAGQWIGVTALAAAGGWLLGMLPPTLLQTGSILLEPVISDTFFVVLLLGLVTGTVFGAAQAWVLRRIVLHAARWIAANALGWSVAMLWIFLAATLPDENTPVLATLGLGAAGGLVAGLCLGAITGRWLPRL
jgi:hypothetical protein